MKISKTLIITLIMMISLINQSESLSFVQIFGLQPLLEDLVKGVPVRHYTGQESISYSINHTLFEFMKNFQSRTGFCSYKCPNFYQLPCFILFKCNIQIRNFFLMIILPVITIIMIGVCCGKGIWTFGCWGRYLGIFTGVFFILWLMKKLVQGYQINNRREKEKEYIHEERIRNQFDMENILTEKRFMGDQQKL